MMREPKTDPIPAPEPATPTVAAPAPMNLAAESISFLGAEVEMSLSAWILCITCWAAGERTNGRFSDVFEAMFCRRRRNVD